MSQYQVYLNDEQKQFLLKYIRERRSDDILLLWATALIFIIMFMLIKVDTLSTNSFEVNELNAECILYMIVSGLTFVKTFINNFGKTFGYRCDIQCIEKDLYTLDYGDFGYREKDTGRHPYYICDNKGDTYVCPKFLDYRNADTGSKFLYIKLENGRGYAIGEDPYMK